MTQHTQVAIVGGGPAGLLLSQLLHGEGIGSVVLERRDRAHLENRIRAGVLEPGTVALLERAGAAERLHRQGLRHDGFALSVDGDAFRVDLRALAGRSVTVYGQTDVTADLLRLHEARGAVPVFEAEVVALDDLDGDAPTVRFRVDGAERALRCDFVAGCDGFHGPCRRAIPAAVRREFERVYPFGWLGILADVPPCDHELIYASHARGFALASMRSPTRSRYYVQVPINERLADWPDARVWDELAERLGPGAAARTVRGPAIERSIAPLRSFVSEPMRHGRLFLAGDAAHIVPPTGAKGLNLAAADVGLLADALCAHYRRGEDSGLERYSDRALERVWAAVRFSWWFTGLTHRFPDMDGFARRMQQAEIAALRRSRAAQTALAEHYVGLLGAGPGGG